MTTATQNHNFETISNRPAIRSVGQDPVFISWTLYEAGTHNITTNTGGVPVTADIHVQFNDVDGPNNERIFVPVCGGTVDWIRIDQTATTGRDFGTVAGRPETFSLIGDKEYSNQPESGLEISYSNQSTFTMGRTADNNFFIRLDNPTYSAADTIDYECGDFTSPVAADDTLTGVATNSAAVVSILLNDSAALANDNPPNNNSLQPSEFVRQAVSVAAPSGATGISTDTAGDVVSFTVPGEGTWSQDDSTGDLTFTPEAGFTGDPTPVTYTFRNDVGQVSNSATVTIDYDAQPPAAVDDTFVSGPIGPVTDTPLSNDSDADGTLDATTVVLTGTGAPAGSTLASDGKTLTVPGEGTWTVNATTGAITFTPEAGVTADPTPASYTVDDNDGNTSNEATVSVTFGDAPVAVDDIFVSGANGPVTDTPLSNDSDADGTLDATTVVLTGTGAPAGSTLASDGKTLTVPGEGTWTVNATTGAITFTPEAGVTADPTPASYTVDDNDGNTSNEATVSVTFGDAPVAVDDTFVSGTIGPISVDPLANDTDGDGALDAATVILTGTDAPDTTLSLDGKTLTVPGEGVWTVDATSGAITFTPEAGFTTDPTPVTYTVDDLDGNTSNEARVSIDFGDAPVAADDATTNPSVVSVTVAPLDNDSDADGTLVAASVVLTATGAPAEATLSSDGKTLTVPGEGVWTVNSSTGEITFAPEADFNSDPTPVAYTVDDNDGNTSNEAFVSIDYDEPPIATNDTVQATEPGPVTINPLNNDSGTVPLDPTTVVFTGTGAPAESTLSSDGKALRVPGEGLWTIDPTTGLVTFTPDAGFSGSPTPAAYVVSDVLGRVSTEATLSVVILAPAEIIASDDGPILLNGADGATSTVSLLSNDTIDGTAITDPTLVSLTPVTLPTLASGSISINADGTVTVAPGTTSGIYTIAYQICETANPTNCATASAEIVVLESDTLISEIEVDLRAILNEDLVNTLAMQSRQISGYSADALNRLRNRSADACLDQVNAHLSENDIRFDVGQAIITPQTQVVINELATILMACPGVDFEIAGHTDSDASESYNNDLSQRRVDAVLGALADRGVDTAGFIARGYGESQPIASNATETGKAQNRRVEFRLLGNQTEAVSACDDEFNLVRSFNANASEAGTTADGRFRQDSQNCVTDSREIYEGSLNYTDTGQGQTQSAITLSYRREQYSGTESVFGYFAGVYGSQSDVTGLASGEVTGFGVNGGVYGAQRLHDAVFLDYYLGAAMGRHEFAMSFDRAVGTIDASGDYTYMAGFAGAAISGELDLGESTLTPRAGFDYIFAPSAEVDVLAELGTLSEIGSLDLDAISGGRLYSEIRSDHLLSDGMANLWINPRVSCFQSLGSLDGVCGFGGSIGIESVGDDDELSYALELSGDWGKDYAMGSLNLSTSRPIGNGSIDGDAGVDSDGNMTMGATVEFEF
ncbi:OmpA family protein [Ponticoccus sp. SC6-64]|nr:OmpA family protein [Ponticoccus sp. SC6-9]MBM1283843.1 OmpA family protein [Ponticoccus sp. SC6-8]MBM1380304.1 OmpA family protein [Ponticoccus sp. SC6-64]